jgi:hypothetical protein
MEDSTDIYGGERGIRTPGTTFGSTRDFQSRSFNQLGHLSVISQKQDFLAFCLWHIALFLLLGDENIPWNLISQKISSLYADFKI